MKTTEIQAILLQQYKANLYVYQVYLDDVFLFSNFYLPAIICEETPI